MSANSSNAVFQDVLQPLVPVAYLGGALILVDQLTQVLVGIAGFDPAQALWRFQTSALLVGRVAAMALGLLLVLGVAQLAGQRRPAWLARAGFGAIAVLLAFGLLSLWVDGPAVKAVAGPGELGGFVIRWIRVLIVGAIALLLIAMVWLRARPRRSDSA